MRKRPSFGLAIGILFLIYLFYLFVLSAPPPDYDREEVENYSLTDANTFRTLPYYKKSTHVRASMDVTIVTQVSVDRLDRIKAMAKRWKAPISVAVYVKSEKDLAAVDELYKECEEVRKFVDFHILFASKTRYPVNNLRNLALTNARTSLVLILDADFITSDDMHEYLSSLGPELKTTKKLAYVIPAFSSDLTIDDMPDTKLQLTTALTRKIVKRVNTGPCPKCHGPTDYDRWQTATESYFVEYKWIYEPYLMLNKDHLQELFDERLKGYGFDKNTHTFTLAVAGYKFLVLPEAFIIHINHPEAAWDGPSIQEQLWDALQYVCDILPTVKHKYGFSPTQQMFEEPVGDAACFSRDHW